MFGSWYLRDRRLETLRGMTHYSNRSEIIQPCLIGACEQFALAGISMTVEDITCLTGETYVSMIPLRPDERPLTAYGRSPSGYNGGPRAQHSPTGAKMGLPCTILSCA